MTTDIHTGRASTRRRPDGPPAGVLAAVSAALTLAAIVLGAALAGHPQPTPYAPTTEIVDYFRGHALAARVNGTLLFGSAIPLGIYAATVYARQLRLGVRVPGPGIGLVGGVLASVMLAGSGIVTWMLGQPVVPASPAAIHAFVFTAFALGGVGYVVGLGLLVAGIAVPALILRFVPRWLAWCGLVIAALSEIAFLSMLLTPLDALLPIGRFAGLGWLIAVGFLLPHDRREVPRTDGGAR